MSKNTSRVTKVAKIKQIIPADGWYMEFSASAPGISNQQPLICWALCEDVSGKEFVTGMFTAVHHGGLTPCSEHSHFVKYCRK